ncbi:hypothetical protein V6N13_079847 [Hibiscus sabdariffa]
MGELREKFRKHTEGRWESSGNGRQQKYIQTTVFVSNLPPRLHWQGLLFAFARKSKQMKNNVLKHGEASKILSRSVGDTSSDFQDSLMKPCLKRVLGHVEEEALKKLEKYLIGTMATVCSTCQVQDRLQT